MHAMCVCVCMSLCLYVYGVCVYVYVCRQEWIGAKMGLNGVFAEEFTLYVSIYYTYACMQLCMCEKAFACAYGCICVCMYVDMYVSVVCL
jgi:hypothetical protein